METTLKPIGSALQKRLPRGGGLALALILPHSLAPTKRSTRGIRCRQFNNVIVVVVTVNVIVT